MRPRARAAQTGTAQQARDQANGTLLLSPSRGWANLWDRCGTGTAELARTELRPTTSAPRPTRTERREMDQKALPNLPQPFS